MNVRSSVSRAASAVLLASAVILATPGLASAGSVSVGGSPVVSQTAGLPGDGGAISIPGQPPTAKEIGKFAKCVWGFLGIGLTPGELNTAVTWSCLKYLNT